MGCIEEGPQKVAGAGVDEGAEPSAPFWVSSLPDLWLETTTRALCIIICILSDLLLGCMQCLNQQV